MISWSILHPVTLKCDLQNVIVFQYFGKFPWVPAQDTDLTPLGFKSITCLSSHRSWTTRPQKRPCVTPIRHLQTLIATQLKSLPWDGETCLRDDGYAPSNFFLESDRLLGKMYSWRSELSSIEERAMFFGLMSNVIGVEYVRWELAPTS